MNACPRCTHDNSADVRVCGNCGLLLDGLCPVCQTQNDHSARFCGNCRHDFAAESSASHEGHAPTPGDLRSQGRPGDPEPTQPRSTSSIPPGIDCPRCMHTNAPDALHCDNCGLIFANVPSRARRPERTVAGFAVGSLGHRLPAFLADGIIVFGIFALLAPLFVGASIVELFDTDDVGNQARNAKVLDTVISVAYGTLLVGAFATTVGKKLLGLSVVRVDGTPVSFTRAFIRSAVKTVSLGLVPPEIALAYVVASIVMVLVRKDRRTIHDMIAGTAVVRR